MSFWDRLLGLPVDEPAPQAQPAAGPPPPQDEITHNIERFETALAECQKPERIAELTANLAYWRAMDDAAKLRPEA